MNLNSKPGDTPLLKSPELSKKFGFTNLLIKDESKNPFGTYKDRRSWLIVQRAKNEHVDKLCLITSGNAGYSLSRFCQNSGIKLVCFIDKNLENLIKEKLKQYSKIIEVDLSKKILNPEEIIALARESNEETIWDVTNGFHDAYATLVKEIEPIIPNFIILPVGSGEAFVGIYNEIKKRKWQTKLIGVGVKDKGSCADKLYTPWTPYKSKIQSILKEGHKIVNLNKKEIEKAYDESKLLFDVEPSSSVVFGVLPKLKVDKESKIIFINSGRGLYFS